MPFTARSVTVGVRRIVPAEARIVPGVRRPPRAELEIASTRCAQPPPCAVVTVEHIVAGSKSGSSTTSGGRKEQPK